jgi:hypothetical protein
MGLKVTPALAESRCGARYRPSRAALGVCDTVLTQAAGTLVFLSGISYVAVGIYLLRKSSTMPGRPEFLLGLAFLFDGFSYGFSEFPFVFGADVLLEEFGFLGRVWGGACSLGIALFTRRVFRPNAAWAQRFVWSIGALIAAGLAVSALEGDWEGITPLSGGGFWLDWLGTMLPFFWLSIESSKQYLITRRRVPLGLIDPLLCNRYLLIAVYATLGTITFFILIPMYIIYQLYGTWSAALDLATGSAEIVSLIALWVSFSAPAFYRRWVCGSDATGCVER